MLEKGIQAKQLFEVEEKNTAKVMGSGTLDVLATPVMIAWMEKTAWESVQPFLEEGQATVGICMDVHHDAPTPVGMSVTVESELIQVDGRRLIFEVRARDEKDEIGSGRHERFVIDSEKFQKKANEKMH